MVYKGDTSQFVISVTEQCQFGGVKTSHLFGYYSYATCNPHSIMRNILKDVNDNEFLNIPEARIIIRTDNILNIEVDWFGE